MVATTGSSAVLGFGRDRYIKRTTAAATATAIPIQAATLMRFMKFTIEDMIT